MSLTSLTFLLAFAGVLAVYHLLQRPSRQNIWLLLVSYAFCATWSGRLTVYMLALTLGNYAVAHLTRRGDRGRRGWLWLGVSLNILGLILFKYTRFFLPEFRGWLADIGQTSQMTMGLSIVMTLGLSYVALQGIAYQVDVYTGRLAPTRRLLDFAVYLIYFPKFIAGPLERPAPFLDQLARSRPATAVAWSRSLGWVALGLVRKVVIADSLATVIPANGWAVWNGVTPPEILVWLMLYAFMLYNDFAGYTDIARGVSGLLGLELSPNFRQPYFARTLAEYWERYHISLTHWLRDYIYLPLSLRLRRRTGRVAGFFALFAPPVVTMLVSGLWHGISPNMVLWGLLHGLYLFGGRWLAQRRGRAATPDVWPWWRQGLGMLRVYGLTVLAFAFFRIDLLFTLAALRGPSLFSVSLLPGWWVIGPVLMSLVLDWGQARAATQPQPDAALRPGLSPAQALAWATALLLVIAAGVANGGAPFVYQGF